MALCLSFGAMGQDSSTITKEGTEVIKLHKGLSCRDAYEKVRGKRFHKRLGHYWLTKRKAEKRLGSDIGDYITNEDVERAIDYGFRIGSYCQQNRLLNRSEFRNITIENIRFLKTADNHGASLESLIEGDHELSCKDLIKMSKNKRKDGYTRTPFGFIVSDWHNIYSAYEREKLGEKARSRADLTLDRKKERYFQRIFRKAIRQYGDNSLTLGDVKKAFEESVEDGTVCSGDRVLSKGELEDVLLDRLGAPKDSGSISDMSSLEQETLRLYFLNGGGEEVRVKNQGQEK